MSIALPMDQGRAVLEEKKDERRRLCGRRTTAFPVFVVENLAAVDEYATTDRSKQQQQQQQQQQKQKMEAIIIIVCEEMPVEYVEEGMLRRRCVRRLASSKRFKAKTQLACGWHVYLCLDA
ncbi:circadian locomoter output cycles protein kaput [Trichinella spiralis]|uniref:circadian locomoter output cycles protein kaput n=1 Tax=Trichinella spiralis TaxID=6334 RepID=UPI0001EFE026|nr:circadian locomoter output cycles protein kaput [Trichinella spiralis]